jgi:hypothetical protein
MTPEERAEKIVKIFMGYEVKQASFYDQVLAEIRTAVEEAYDEANKDFDWLQSAVGRIYCSLTNNKLSKWNTDPALLISEVEDIQNELIYDECQKAKAEAYQDAAKIAEMWVDNQPFDPANRHDIMETRTSILKQYGNEISNQIRARAKESEG